MGNVLTTSASCSHFQLLHVCLSYFHTYSLPSLEFTTFICSLLTLPHFRNDVSLCIHREQVQVPIFIQRVLLEFSFALIDSLGGAPCCMVKRQAKALCSKEHEPSESLNWLLERLL